MTIKNELINIGDTKMGREIKKDTKANAGKPTEKKRSPFVKAVIAHWEDAKIVFKNFSDFIETVSLAIVTGFAIYGALNYELRTEYKYAVLFAGVVVGLRAFNLLHEFLKRK